MGVDFTDGLSRLALIEEQLSIGTDRCKVIPRVREPYVLYEVGVRSNYLKKQDQDHRYQGLERKYLVMLERHAIEEYDGTVVRSSDCSEWSLMPYADGINNLKIQNQQGYSKLTTEQRYENSPSSCLGSHHTMNPSRPRMPHRSAPCHLQQR